MTCVGALARQSRKAAFRNPSAVDPWLDDASPLQQYYEAGKVSGRRQRLCLPHAADNLRLTLVPPSHSLSASSADIHQGDGYVGFVPAAEAEEL